MKYIKLLSLLLCGFYMTDLFAQKRIAVTIDDPNSYDTPLVSWQERNNAILKVLEHHKIKAALFVCGIRVDDDKGKRLLEEWDQKGHLICNHSYSHYYYHARSKTSEVYITDFLKGDSVVRGYKNYTKLFRFPFLKEGNTAEKRDEMRLALLKNGYKNGYVTIDASDWYIDSKIIEALKQNKDTSLEAFKEYYIQHILDRAGYYDGLSQKVFRRNIPHTLLIHHSLLNALFLGDLLNALKSKGWTLINADEAYQDEVFNRQPLVEPCGESLVWQSAKLDSTLARTLRYPAEDGEYEKEALKKFVQDYPASLKTKNK